MGAGRKTQTFIINGSEPSAATPANSSVTARNLKKSHLGGVIFGCTRSTINECLSKQLFGLPAQHFSYIKKIDAGLPLFLFNYSDRKLHGIYEAASHGQMNINPYGWTVDGSERTLYPAQVQIRVRLRCQPLVEDQFRSIIRDNYYSHNHFWFELDHAQTSKLMSVLSSFAIAPGTSIPQSTEKWRNISQARPTVDGREEGEEYKPLALDVEPSNHSSWKSDSTDFASSLDGDNQLSESRLDLKVVEQDEKDLICMKLKEVVLNRECQYPPLTGYVEDISVVNDMLLEDKDFLGEQMGSEEKNEDSLLSSSDYQSVITQLIRGMEELKAFKTEQTQKHAYVEQKLVEAEIEIQQLKDRCMMLESRANLSLVSVDESVIESVDELLLDPTESIYLVGGYDGESWLSALDSYYPSQDVIKHLKPMGSVRSYASVAQLNNELYIFGGGNGFLWYDTVESYSLANDQWTLRPSLNEKKGSLAGATLKNKLFAIGGGNGVQCFSDVEMLDLDIGRWISTRSMLQKRFALAAAELNGVLYATGGYDGNDYIKSAERFDPREHSWTRIAAMDSKRGCHSLVVLKEKLYALGGFVGSSLAPTVEIYDPRLDAWMPGESMNYARGYAAAAVVKESIYVIGGVKIGDNIVDTVECYKEGQGWQETNARAIGKRCFASAFVF